MSPVATPAPLVWRTLPSVGAGVEKTVTWCGIFFVLSRRPEYFEDHPVRIRAAGDAWSLSHLQLSGSTFVDCGVVSCVPDVDRQTALRGNGAGRHLRATGADFLLNRCDGINTDIRR